MSQVTPEGRPKSSLGRPTLSQVIQGCRSHKSSQVAKGRAKLYQDVPSSPTSCKVIPGYPEWFKASQVVPAHPCTNQVITSYPTLSQFVSRGHPELVKFLLDHATLSKVDRCHPQLTPDHPKVSEGDGGFPSFSMFCDDIPSRLRLLSVVTSHTRLSKALPSRPSMC